MPLKDLHLADLHARARELDVPDFRMLTRDQLIEAIERSEGEKPSEDGGRGRRRRKRPAAPAAEKAEAKKPAPDVDEAETEEVTGILDRMPQGYGFLRLAGLEPTDGDVYVSASQIRRCELRPGDEVSGPARAPRRGERHRALVRVAAVNGGEPEADRTPFEELTPKAPHREFPKLSVDLPEPLAFGHRALVLAGEASEASDFLRAIASGLEGSDASIAVLLAGSPADEEKDWEKIAPDASFAGGGGEMEARDRVRAAELALGRAKRRAEAGDDMVVLIDSLSSLAEGYRDVSRVKRLFGSGRELAEEGSGSLTVIAAVVEADERAGDVKDALEGTEDVQVQL